MFGSFRFRIVASKNRMADVDYNCVESENSSYFHYHCGRLGNAGKPTTFLIRGVYVVGCVLKLSPLRSDRA
ncbi:hypothetical protein Y032_0067g101 [Ancylostoma ceylanicum]|uniref:Uncharacterized protein n=1 Tax=Ancylostoma ceylanicum TaxID=53326 RepID=A0A016TYG5_9BILA|nr:hypothetical protein Y032_0067g101 [Ancylostoma ceylanicum]